MQGKCPFPIFQGWGWGPTQGQGVEGGFCKLGAPRKVKIPEN